VRKRRLLVLGAGPAQLGLLEAARARGDLHVVVADRDPLAPGFALADERAVISSEDEEALDRLARARELDGVISPGADWPVGIAARIAERLGVFHPIDGATGAVVTSKTRQRERFAASGVPHAREVVVATGAGLGPEAAPLPVVVKAPDLQGQRGLTLVRQPAELTEAMALAAGEARFGTVLVEELVEGPEVTVNAVGLNGTFHPLAVTDRLTAEPPAFGVALAHAWPSALGTDEAIAVARDAAAAVGIRHGPSYTQIRLGADGPRVMEIAARLGGGHDAELVEAATGIDLNALAVGFALGENPCNDQLQGVGREVGGACVVFLVAPEGVLRGVEGVEEAEAAAGVRRVRLYRRPGWRFGPLRRGPDRAGAILAVGDSRDDALERARRAAESVRFVVDADAP
jgi:biotin carboxylase